jgi:hypothetical protein
VSSDSELLRPGLEEIQATVLARPERRFRGLTPTERNLLESTTLELVDEFLVELDRGDISSDPGSDAEAAAGGERKG